MRKVLMMLFAVATVASASGSCALTAGKSVDVTWKAYKTPAKIGVGGHFKESVYKSEAVEAKSLSDLLVGASMVIDVSSVDSNNPERDAKLVNSFFEMMVGEDIKAKVVALQTGDVKDGDPEVGTVTIAVTMNAITKEVPMTYRYHGGKVSALGVIDIFDFQAQSALSSINKACFDLHQGKTWSDVEIGFTMPVKRDCTTAQ